MSSNSFGKVFQVSTYGESHGVAIGVTIDGCPSGVDFDLELVQRDLDRRRPGQSKIVTQRKESDTVQLLSGVFENKTTGTPIAMVIYNEDQRSKDYSHISEKYRPSHADFTYQEKYGIRDYRGGGRSSARETAARVAAGAVAKQVLRQAHDVEIFAYVDQVGDLILKKDHTEVDLSLIENSMVRCPDPDTAAAMEDLIKGVRKDGDTIGGVVKGLVKGCPVGLGAPAFDKLHADLAKAMLSINACKGFEYGSGFSGVTMRGSQHNDRFVKHGEDVATTSNFSGGIQGGISNGMDIYFRVAFKPVATLMQDQPSIDQHGDETIVSGKGRHDPCVVPRAVAIVEAMAALVLVDHMLRSRTVRL
nr:chorismate synthase-like [Nerophis lumbriciformis]